MLIALDYDFTYTKDPDMWDEFVRFAKLRGHTFICVTGRDAPPGIDERRIPMPVLCAAGEPKSRAAFRNGYNVHVWIDDAPGTIPAIGPLDWS